MTLLEKIEEMRAMSVTNDQFEKMWGYSIEEYLSKMMKLVEQDKAKKK